MDPSTKKLARFLGAASAGIGISQLLMPGRFAEWIGVRPDDDARRWTRIVGVRELGVTGPLLTRERPATALWARVAGDMMDLALLAAATPEVGERSGPLRRRTQGELRRRHVAAMGAVIGIMGVDALAATAVSRTPSSDEAEDSGPEHVKATITVLRPREDVYAFWRDLGNLPRFMAHVESIEPSGDGRSHWKVKAPIGGTVDWDAEVVGDRPNEMIAWRSIAGADVQNAGTVRFVSAPGDRGTEVHVDMSYDAPGGVVGATVAKLLGEEPQQQVEDDLRRFKQVIETGEVVRSDGSPEGALARRQLRQRPAQPLAGADANGRKS